MNHAPAPGRDWPPTLLPTDRRRGPGDPSRSLAVIAAELQVPCTQDLLLAGFAALLFRYTGHDRISFDRTEGSGRVVHVRLRNVGASTLSGLAGRWSAGIVAGADPAPVAITFASTAVPARDAQYDLRLVARAGAPGRHALELHYDTGLFEAATARRLLDHYIRLVEDGLAFEDRPVSQLRLLTETELHRTLVEWNSTAAELPYDVCLHEAFEARAAQTPEAIALVHGTRRWTYRRINGAANRLARQLRDLGVGPDVRVGLCLDRSADLLVAVLGILKAGGCYVPLDPEYPRRRLAAMIEGTSCAVMLSREDLTANLPNEGTGSGLALVLVDAEALAAQPEDDIGSTAGPEDLCYIIHTSGSTGAPKPIALRHRGVMNNLADLNCRFGIGPGDSTLALSSPSFDMSVYEFLGITTAGGTVVVPDGDRTKDPAHWAALLAGENITVWNSAPALLTLLTDHFEQTGAGTLPSLRLSMLGGDWVPVPLCDRIRRFAPGLRFIVLGGATEASIHSTIFEVEQTDPDWISIPYGRPMANQRTYILDDALQPVPPGVPGELYLAGTGLAREYLDQPERTAERFIEWSYGPVEDERLYRTGDLARFRPDGLIELLGRRDFQVKVNGLRVELGEIEAALRAHPAVREAAVADRDGRLVAYVVPGGDLDTADLRDFAGERLPEFMVPRAIVPLERLPLTPNGKLDRRNLPEPESAGAAYRAPGSPLEEVLARVFAEVLGRGRVGVDDDFLALGGDSVRAIQVVTRARARGIGITTRQVFEERNVVRLARAAGSVEAAEAGTAPLVRVDPGDLATWRGRHPRLAEVWPLTSMQFGMLFESMLAGEGRDPYQMQTLYHLSGRIDPVRIRSAAQALLDRFPNLGVAFATDSSDTMVQLVVDGVEPPWREVDLSGLPDEERLEALRRFLEEDRSVRFDLADPPLLRMALVRLADTRAVLVLTAHHALLDGWSEQILARDLLRLYAADSDTAREPGHGYRDFLVWLSRQDCKESARIWAGELSGLEGPTLLLPAGTAADAALADRVELTLSPDESRRLAQCCARLGVTASTVVQGAWAVLLATLTGRTDVVFGATVSGRPGSLTGVESMAGLFINTLPVRVQYTPDSTAAELLTELQARQTALLDHQHHDLAEIQEAVGLGPLFDTLVVHQSYPGHLGDAVPGDLEVIGVESLGQVTYPLTLIAEGDRFTVQYHPGRVTREGAADIAAGFRSVLEQLTADTGRRVGELKTPTRPTLDAVPATAPDGGAPISDAPAGPGQDEAGTRAFWEATLHGLLTDVLGVERIGADDDFFRLGVNSLKATRLIGRLRRTHGVEVSIRTVFQYRTITELAARLAEPGTAPAEQRRPRLGKASAR